jgi:hypothetical protein
MRSHVASGRAALSDQEILARAFRAVERAMRRAGAPRVRLEILYRSRRICLLAPEISTVARVTPAEPHGLAAATRELDVARYLSERDAPVVAPSSAMPREPWIEEGMIVTLWRHVAHRKADYDDEGTVADAAFALRRVHEALADYPGALPPYLERIEECARLLRRSTAPPILSDGDRKFLLHTYDRLHEALDTFDVGAWPIHGDAHMGNVFVTAGGCLWTDFETASLGPYEWDAAGAPHLAAFRALDPKLFAVMSELRSLCVTVWCSALAADPAKRAAAGHHLARLRAAHGALADRG